MRRSLVVSALAATLVGLGTGPAWAHPHDDGGGWEPVPDDYWAPVEIEACGDEIRIEGGDVREAEIKEIRKRNGARVVELRGEATFDLTRLSDGAEIDELDIGGPGVEKHSADGRRVTITLFGASLLYPTADPNDREAFEDAGLPDLAYYTDPHDEVTFRLRLDPDDQTVESVDIDVDADIVDLCDEFDERDDDNGDDENGDDENGDDENRDDENEVEPEEGREV